MAIIFDGNESNYLGRTTGILNHNAAYTWMAWVRVDSLVDSNVLAISKEDDTAFEGIGINTSPAGEISIFIDGGSSGNGGTVSASTYYHMALVRESTTSLKFYLDGVLNATVTTNVGSRAAATRMALGTFLGSGSYDALDGRITACKIWDAALTIDEVKNEIRSIRPIRFANLWQFAPLTNTSSDVADYAGSARNWTLNGTLSSGTGPAVGWGSPPIFKPGVAAAGGITGNLSLTLGALTVSGAGGVLVAGALSKTLGVLTDSGAGSVLVAGTLSKTLGALTLSATGTVGITGSLSLTLGVLTDSGAGAVSVVGTEATTLGALTASATGSVGTTGTLLKTLGAMTVNGAGGVGVAGVETTTLGALTLSATGSVGIAGSLSLTLGALTVSADGGAPAITGDLSLALGALTLSGAGGVLVAGAEATTLGALTASGAGGVGVAGAEATTLGAMTASATGSVTVGGALSSTLGALTLSATGTVGITGTLSLTLGALTVSADGGAGITGALSVMLGVIVCNASGTVGGVVIAPGNAELLMRAEAILTMRVERDLRMNK